MAETVGSLQVIGIPSSNLTSAPSLDESQTGEKIRSYPLSTAPLNIAPPLLIYSLASCPSNFLMRLLCIVEIEIPPAPSPTQSNLPYRIGQVPSSQLSQEVQASRSHSCGRRTAKHIAFLSSLPFDTECAKGLYIRTHRWSRLNICKYLFHR
jgi:hypothetical protein